MLRAFRQCSDWFRKLCRAIGPIAIVTVFLMRCLPFVVAESIQAHEDSNVRNDTVQFRTVFAANIGEFLFFSMACWRMFMDTWMATDRMNLAVSLICFSVATLLAGGALVGGSVRSRYRTLLLEVSDNTSPE